MTCNRGVPGDHVTCNRGGHMTCNRGYQVVI